MTFEEICTTLRVTPEERQAMAEHLAAMRAKATLKAFAPAAALSREHSELMLLAAHDLESWMKSHGRDGATEETVKRLREAALGEGEQR